MNMHKFSLNMQDKHNYVQIIIDYAENPGVISSVTDCYHPTNPRSFRTHYSIADAEWISKHSLHVNHLPCDRLENFSAYYWTPRSTPTRALAYRGVSLKTWWLPPRHCQGISTGQENGHQWLRKHMIGRKHVGPRQAVRSSRDSHRLLTRQTVRSSSLFRYVRVNGRTWGQRRPRGLASGSIFEYCVTGTTPRHRPTTSFTPPDGRLYWAPSSASSSSSFHRLTTTIYFRVLLSSESGARCFLSRLIQLSISIDVPRDSSLHTSM